MKLIVGLGNIGEHYERTRHNAGFLAIDNYATSECHERSDAKERSAIWYKGGAYETSYILCKPQTFMNRSGTSVKKIAHFFKIAVEDIVVLHDDIDLPDGKIEFKVGGGHAGHNGLRDIIKELGTNTFSRIRIGIGRPATKEEVVEYVLDVFSKQELITLEKNYDKINDLIINFLKK